jgi:cyclopropane-fatty-acyl-phospholipid synthase
VIDRLAERAVREVLVRADVQIDGARPWDLRVRHPAFYRRLALNPSFQLGETYVDGLWECDAIDELLHRLMTSEVGARLEYGWKSRLRGAVAALRNLQSRRRATEVAERHYDAGTDLFERMLDDSMTYTCAFFERDDDPLERAQEAKMRMLCDRLALQPGETLLDIGCGFGGLAAFAARRYGVRVFAISNSREHVRVARERHGGRPDVEFALMDYRDLPATGRRFDKAVSVEMIEAVGPKNYRRYMRIVHDLLPDGGRFALQTFIADTPQRVCNEWFDRHIFPNGVTPSLVGLARASEDNFGTPGHLLDIGPHYAATLKAWHDNVERAWPELPARYDERFRRMWRFYLLCLAGVFRAGGLRLCQLAYTRARRRSLSAG